MNHFATTLEHAPRMAITMDSLERRLVSINKTLEWFHRHGVNMDVVERHLGILDRTVQHIKKGEQINKEMTAKEDCQRNKKEVWELLSKFYGMIFHQKALLLVAFKLVGDITKFDEDTLQVAGVLKEIEEEEEEEISEEEEEEGEEVSSEYVNASWERLEGTFPPIKDKLVQLRQHGMDTSIYRESFGILTYTIWRMEQAELSTKVETYEERFKEEKEKLGELLDRLDEFLGRLIRPWKARLLMMEEIASYDRANYQVVYMLVEEEKNPSDPPNATSAYPVNYKRRVVSTHRDFLMGCGRPKFITGASLEEEDEEDPSEDEALEANA